MDARVTELARHDSSDDQPGSHGRGRAAEVGDHRRGHVETRGPGERSGRGDRVELVTHPWRAPIVKPVKAVSSSATARRRLGAVTVAKASLSDSCTAVYPIYILFYL